MDSELLRRRQFLELLGYAALSVQVACAGETAAPADSLAVTSSRASKLGDWVAHTHLLYVPMQLFRAPPREGVALSTTRTFLHSHEVVLTEAQLAAVVRGDTVLVEDAVAAHTYSIALS
jgi:hypothetical protein